MRKKPVIVRDFEKGERRICKSEEKEGRKLETDSLRSFVRSLSSFDSCSLKCTELIDVPIRKAYA